MSNGGVKDCEEWGIASSADPQATIFVRARGHGGAAPVILVHGFFQPASAILDVPGYSLQQALADAGLRVYLFDLRGYGHSTRPAFMDAPPQASRPGLGCMADAIADLTDVADFVQRQENAKQLDVVGYSWGTARAARFALQEPARVRRLALYAPVWRPLSGAPAEACDPDKPQQLNPHLGGYRVIGSDSLQSLWDWEIGDAAPGTFRSPEALASAKAALMASDASWRGPREAFRAPLGPMVDALHVLHGGSLFDAARLRCDAILLRGAQDRLSTEQDAAALFAELGSPHKRQVTFPRGTHLLHLEHARGKLVAAVLGFLTEAAR